MLIRYLINSQDKVQSFQSKQGIEIFELMLEETLGISFLRAVKSFLINTCLTIQIIENI